MTDTPGLLARLRAACLDIETGEPLDGDARPDIHVDDVRAVLALLTAGSEGMETTAEERLPLPPSRIRDPRADFPINTLEERLTRDPSATRRVVFQYLVPVHVEVEDGLVVCVTVIDETPVRDPTLVEGEAGYLPEAVAAADDGQPWPSWRFGY